MFDWSRVASLESHGRDQTDFVSSHRYATKAFQDDNALKPMGLYVREKGKALNEGRYEVAVYKLLREFGDDENAGSGDDDEEEKEEVIDVTEQQPTRRTLSGPRVSGFKLIGHEVRQNLLLLIIIIITLVVVVAIIIINVINIITAAIRLLGTPALVVVSRTRTTFPCKERTFFYFLSLSLHRSPKKKTTKKNPQDVKLPVGRPCFWRTKFAGSLPEVYPAVRVDFVSGLVGHGLRAHEDIKFGKKHCCLSTYAFFI